MPKVPSSSNVDLATSRWISIQKSKYSQRFCDLMPKQRQRIGVARTIRTMPPGVRLIVRSSLDQRQQEPDQPSTSVTNQLTASIPKPTNLTSGKFETYLQWTSEDYAAIKATIKDFAEKSLDFRLSLKDQNKDKLQDLRVNIRIKYPLLTRYENDWATDEFLRRLLKNTSSRARSKKLERPDGTASVAASVVC